MKIEGFSSKSIHTNSDVSPFFGCCSIVYTPEKKRLEAENGWLKDENFFWDGIFSGANCLLDFGDVNGEG